MDSFAQGLGGGAGLHLVHISDSDGSKCHVPHSAGSLGNIGERVKERALFPGSAPTWNAVVSRAAVFHDGAPS